MIVIQNIITSAGDRKGNYYLLELIPWVSDHRNCVVIICSADKSISTAGFISVCVWLESYHLD